MMRTTKLRIEGAHQVLDIDRDLRVRINVLDIGQDSARSRRTESKAQFVVKTVD